jgi:hypothetical protein
MLFSLGPFAQNLIFKKARVTCCVSIPRVLKRSAIACRNLIEWCLDEPRIGEFNVIFLSQSPKYLYLYFHRMPREYKASLVHPNRGLFISYIFYNFYNEVAKRFFSKTHADVVS